MFRLLSSLALAVVCGNASAQVAPAPPASPTTAPKPKVAIRSGEVIPCQLNMGCTEETAADGSRTYILEADGYIVKAAFAVDQLYSHADVTVVNNTPYKTQLIPAEFRVDVVQPKYKRLSYLDPKRLGLGAKTPKRGGGLPPPSYFTSEKHLKDKQKEAAAAPVPALRARELAPSERASGRVYFGHPGKAATEMSLVLPISGALFEFSYPPVSAPTR